MRLLTRTHRLSIAAIASLGVICALIASRNKSRKPDETSRKSADESLSSKVSRTSASVMEQQFLAKMAELDNGSYRDFHVVEFHRIAGETHDSSTVFEAASVYFEFTPDTIGTEARGRKEILIYQNGHLWQDTDLERELDLKKSRFDGGELKLYSMEGKFVRITFQPKLGVQPSDDFVGDPW